MIDLSRISEDERNLLAEVAKAKGQTLEEALISLGHVPPPRQDVKLEDTKVEFVGVNIVEDTTESPPMVLEPPLQVQRENNAAIEDAVPSLPSDFAISEPPMAADTEPEEDKTAEIGFEKGFLNNKLKIKSVGKKPFRSMIDGGSAEWMLDIQTAMSLAPGADIIFYKADDIFGALKAAADDNEADIITSSFGTNPPCEGLDTGAVAHNRFDALYKQLAQQGQTMLRGMGDMGTIACSKKGSNPPDNLTPSIVSGAGSPWVTVLSGITISQIEPLIAKPWNSTTKGMGGGSGICLVFDWARGDFGGGLAPDRANPDSRRLHGSDRTEKSSGRNP